MDFYCMKKYLMPLFLALAPVLSGCEKEPDVNTSLPEIDLGKLMNLTVPMEGGEAVIEYRIVNPVEGGTISAKPTENWLGGFNYDTPGRIVFNVDENTADEDRSSIVTLTYTYDENESVTAQLNVIQASYDYVIDCTFMSGTYYGSQYGLNGEYNYYTILSDMEYNDGAMDGGSYYAFDLYTASAPENPDNPLPAAGTYVLGEQGATADMTFAPDHTQALRTSVDGEVVFDVGFTEGTLIISYDGGVMHAEASLTDETGMRHYLTYSGNPDYDNASGGSGGETVLNQDIDMEASQGAAVYVSGEEGGLMEVQLTFTDMEVDFFGYVVPPGSILNVDVFMHYDESGNIATGDYTLAGSSVPEAMSINPGEYFNYMGVTLTMGTYISYIDESENVFEGLISDGEMKVSGEPGNYTVECSFVTAEGYSVECSYNGALEVTGFPGPYSTLTDDYTLDLEGASGSAQFWGDYYGNGTGNWIVVLESAMDVVQLELITEEVDFSAGLTSAVYTPSVDPVNPAPGEYVTGYLDGDYLMGTNYMETLEGLIVGCAPAVSGDLSITNNGDDTYTISFAFTDDLGHVWDGEWTGVLDFSNRSYAPERTFCRKSGEVSVSENYMSPYKADNVRVINKMLRRAERG